MREDNRSLTQIRKVEITPHFTRYAEGSVLFCAGETRVLCNASIENSVPEWMKGRGKGWISAEYSMLPRSTHTRSRRDREKVSGRTQEIQRLIGRSLRAVINPEALGERSIILDCDVLQADGGTRTAAINGGFIAMKIAIQKLLDAGALATNPITDSVAAISVGLKGDQVLVDLNYEEDSSCDVDMNFVITGQGRFVEIQGTAERASFDRAQMNRLTDSAISACQEISRLQSKY